MTEFDPENAWAELDATTTDTVEPIIYTKPPKHYRPFSEAADRFIREAQQTKRFYTGIPQFDAEMRGLSPGHLGVVVGYSHSGKTQLVLHMLRNNREANIAWFTPDEPGPLLLTKLTSLTHNIPARILEERVASGDREAIALLRQTAEEEFPNLIVFDKPLTPSVLNDGYKEACDVWGAAADITVVDYVDLVQGPEVVPQKFDILKSFVSVNETAMWAIHQTSRSGGAEGKAMTISSGNYGGEQHATMMIGVRRKVSAISAEIGEQRVKMLRNPTEATAERIKELEYEMGIAAFTLTANVVKNKRPGGGLVDEIDFEIAMSTGRIFQLANGDLPQQWLRRNQQQGTPPAPVAAVPNYTETELWEAA
jgi:hypothetical protein